MSDNFLLETTAVIDFLFKPKLKEKIFSVLHDASQKTTLNYVKMEIKRGFLNNLVLLYNKIRESNKLSDVFDYLSTISSTPLKKQLSTMLEALAICSREVERERPDRIREEYGNVDNQLIEIAGILRLKILRLFRQVDKMVDTLLNPMDCFVDIKPPVEMKKWGRIDNKPSWCSGSKKECSIKKFFIDNVNSFKQIYEQLKEIPEKDRDVETQKRIKSLKKILGLLPSSTRYFGNHHQNYRLCWNCGDAVIAVATPENFIVLNNNESHYLPICRIIGKKSMTYR